MDNYRSIGNQIRIIDRYSQMYFMEELKDLDLHGPGQFRIVMKLSRFNRGITQEQLAKILIVDKGSISRMIRPLLANGIVERKPNPDDKRAYLLKLSEEAQPRIPEILDRAKKWTGILSQGFTPDEVDLLFSYLERLKANAELYLKGGADD